MDDVKKEKAVAIEYTPENFAPKVTASGRGPVAQRIIDIARENGVPIVEDPALVEVLSRLDLDSVIPPELYQIVAEVLAFVYKIDKGIAETGSRV